MPFSECVRLLEGGESDLHCGGVDGGQPLPLTFGRRRFRTGLVARRAVEDPAPLRLLEDLARDIALERFG